MLSTSTAVPAFAQDQSDVQKKLQSVEEEIEARHKRQASLEASKKEALSQAEKLSHELVIVARDIRNGEDNANRLEDRIALLETTESEKKMALEGRQRELLELLSALERLSRRPAALALLKPDEALTTARSAALMGTIVPDINNRASLLRRELEGLSKIQSDLSIERYQLKNTLEDLTDHQLKIGSLLKRRQTDARKASNEARKIARELRKFAQEAATLKELIEKLAQQAANRARTPVKPDRLGGKGPAFRPNGRPIAEVKGSLPYPVIGRVVHRFGEKESVGEARGIRIATRPGAQVVAPYDGKIVFAGPFRDYGQLLIIEHGNGYHSLMAGFGELYSAVGQWVLTGEPVGAMKAIAGTELQGANQLYMEMRKGGRSINPVPWLSKKLASSR